MDVLDFRITQPSMYPLHTVICPYTKLQYKTGAIHGREYKTFTVINDR